MPKTATSILRNTLTIALLSTATAALGAPERLVVGAWAASRDRAGRAFPLVVFGSYDYGELAACWPGALVALWPVSRIVARRFYAS